MNFQNQNEDIPNLHIMALLVKRGGFQKRGCTLVIVHHTHFKWPNAGSFFQVQYLYNNNWFGGP